MAHPVRSTPRSESEARSPAEVPPSEVAPGSGESTPIGLLSLASAFVVLLVWGTAGWIPLTAFLVFVLVSTWSVLQTARPAGGERANRTAALFDGAVAHDAA